MSAIFHEKIEIRGRYWGFPGFWDSIPKLCKGRCCVDLGERFPTNTWLQNICVRIRIALAEIFTMHSFAPFWNRIPKPRKTVGRKEPGPDNHGHRFGIESQKPGKPWGEKNLVQPREKWPGEAHKQPQLATQYYLRARSEECLRIRNKRLTGDFKFNSM